MSSPARLAFLALFVAALGSPAAVQAHFQTVIPSADVLPEGGEVTVDILFTHPFEGGPIMGMKRPAEVGVFAGGKKISLMDSLASRQVQGKTAWSLTYPLAEPGAAIFYVTPQPYWEPSEGKYIIHYTKVVVDSFASGEGWDELVGLPVEIRPLTRPTGIWAGNVFSGVVLKAGEPAPFVTVEVEFINEDSVRAPNDAFITQVLTTDANGTFTYAMPRAGWWGFAALLDGEATMTSPEGQQAPVETGALIWVKATEMEAK